MNTLVETDRRQSARLAYDGPVEIETFACSGWVSGHGRDLSEGGLSVRLNEHFDLHTVVRMRLSPPRARGPVECLGRVAWTTARMDLVTQPPYPYDVGIEFVKVPAVIRRQLAATYEHLRRRAQPPTPVPHVRTASIGGQQYTPVLTYEGIPRPAWHLIVQAEGVPCFAQRFATASEAVAGWQTFRQARESSFASTRKRQRDRR